MPKFIYKAKKGLSETIEGSIEAENQDAALNKLAAQNLFPISIVEVPPFETHLKKARRIPSFIRFGRRITNREILIFTQQLLTLTRAKVELLSSLRVICEQTDNPAVKDIILEMYNFTKDGKAFSESLAKFPAVFSPLFVNIVRAGEASGRLDYALEQISEFLQREENLRMKIRMALAYPVLLLLVGAVSIFVLISFVIPKLRPILEGMGRQLPLMTNVVLKISAFSNKSWFWVVGVFAVFAIFLYYRKGAPFYNRMMRKIKLHLPIIKRLLKNQELAHFARSFALLLSSGVVALKSLEIAMLTVEDPKLQAELKEVTGDVASGESLAKSMERRTDLPKFFTKMIAVGEESGRLGEVLGEILRSYTQQIETDIMLISALLEPLLILGLGVILGSIVLSILLPTFQITQIVR